MTLDVDLGRKATTTKKILFLEERCIHVVRLVWSITGSPGYSLSAGYYTPSVTSALSVQPSSLSAESSSRLPASTSPSTPAQTQYPTYIGTQLGPMQISPTQNPYAAAATGHPLYPSPLTGLQVQTQQAQVSSLQGQIPGRQIPLGTATALQYPAYPAHATSPTLPGASFYPSYWEQHARLCNYLNFKDEISH